MGLAYDLKKVNNYRIARQLLLEHKDLLIQSLKDSFITQKESWEAKVTEISKNLSEKLSDIQALIERYKANKDRELSTKIRSIKKSLKNDWKQWRQIVKSISKEAPLKA